MKSSLVKLVGVILREIQQDPEHIPSESGLRSWLSQQGYSKRDIDAAMKLVRPRFTRPAEVSEHRPHSVRLLSEFEASKLSVDVRDAIVRLDMYELISPAEREMLLERLTQMEGVVGLDELDYTLSWLVCSVRDVEYQQTIYTVMEGRGDSLH